MPLLQEVHYHIHFRFIRRRWQCLNIRIWKILVRVSILQSWIENVTGLKLKKWNAKGIRWLYTDIIYVWTNEFMLISNPFEGSRYQSIVSLTNLMPTMKVWIMYINTGEWRYFSFVVFSIRKQVNYINVQSEKLRSKFPVNHYRWPICVANWVGCLIVNIRKCLQKTIEKSAMLNDV